MLRLALQHAGLVVVSAFTHEIRDGAVDVGPFIEQHQPRAIIYDIAPPYEANWQLFLHIRSFEVMRGRFFIITTTNAREVEKLAGSDQHIYEIVGKPYDLDLIVQAAREAVRARPTA